MLTIRHTRAEGTVVEGTSRGDGTNTILAGRDGLGLRWDDDNQRWYQRRSRNRTADQHLISTAEARLKAAGHQVEVTIDNTTPATSFGEREAESYARADRRAETRNQWADSATASSNAAYAKVRQIADGIPFGQPILVGHHSEARARRDQRRMHEGMRKSIDESKRAAHHADRAHAAEQYQRRRENVPTTLRRIEKIEARRRAIARELTGRRGYEGGHIPCPPSRAAELQAEDVELADELTYWRAHVEARQAEGVKVWQRSDFQPGDFVRRTGTWFEVLRVNAKSLTIPALVSSSVNGVVRAENGYSWTHLLRYDEIHGRRSAQEMNPVAAPEQPAEAVVAPAPRQAPRSVEGGPRQRSAPAVAPGSPESLTRLLELAPGLASLLAA